MAWALLFPHRTILFMLFFPMPVRVAVTIMGAIAFFSAVERHQRIGRGSDAPRGTARRLDLPEGSDEIFDSISTTV